MVLYIVNGVHKITLQKQRWEEWDTDDEIEYGSDKEWIRVLKGEDEDEDEEETRSTSNCSTDASPVISPQSDEDDKYQDL